MLLTDLIFVNHLVAARWGWRHDFLPFPTLYPGHNFCSYFCNKGRIMKKKTYLNSKMLIQYGRQLMCCATAQIKHTEHT